MLEVHGRLLQLRTVLVGRVDVADRALPRPLGGQDQDAHERRRLMREPSRTPARGPTRTRRHPARTRPCAPRSGCRARRARGSGSLARDACGCRRPHPAGSRCGRSGSTQSANGSSWIRRERRAPSALLVVSSSCQTSACPSTCASPKCAVSSRRRRRRGGRRSSRPRSGTRRGRASPGDSTACRPPSVEGTHGEP